MTTRHDSAERWQVPTRVVPDDDDRPLWVDGGRLTRTPIPDAVRLPGSFALPGLVDAHAHLAIKASEPVGLGDTVAAAIAALDTGVLLIRDLGAPHSVTLDLPDDPRLPRVISAGRWLAVEGKFFPDWHEPVAPEELIAAALAEVRRGASWVKVLTDWSDPQPTYPIPVLRDMVDAVHAAGARVAAHNQGTLAVVETGVDSIEHGASLDETSLRAMAARGTAWTPTLGALEDFRRDIDRQLVEGSPHSDRTGLLTWRDQLEAGIERLRYQLPLAAQLGITILAGTDRVGTVVDEVRLLVRYGLEPVQALKAATTDARAFLGVPGLQDGAPADFVTYATNPLLDLSVLDSPTAVVLGGRRIR